MTLFWFSLIDYYFPSLSFFVLFCFHYEESQFAVHKLYCEKDNHGEDKEQEEVAYAAGGRPSVKTILETLSDHLVKLWYAYPLQCFHILKNWVYVYSKRQK